MPGTLVAGFDGSRYARAALRLAGRRAAAENGRLVVVCAHPLPPPELNDRARAALLADHRREADEILGALRADPPPELAGVQVAYVAEGGTPCEALMSVAAREDAEALVVGTHGRGRVSALLGSVAHDLLRRADRPVLAIPPGAVDRLEPEDAVASGG
jgi:nucleotide-binding universal stress UspA family protein